MLTPGRPDDPHQPRPALVVSADVRNRLVPHAIVVPIYSSGAPAPTRVQVPAGAGGLRRDSILFCEEISTIDRTFFRRGPWGERVTAEVMASVIRSVRRAIGEVVPEAEATE